MWVGKMMDERLEKRLIERFVRDGLNWVKRWVRVLGTADSSDIG